MIFAKDGIRSQIRIGYDGKVHKTFCGPNKDERFENETRALEELEARGCDFVPRILELDRETLTITTTSCGHLVQDLPEERLNAIFEMLKDEFGVIHADPRPENLTFDSNRGRFCIINFEEATILGNPMESKQPVGLEWFGTTRSGARKPDNEDSLAVFGSESGWAKSESLQGRRKISDGPLAFALSDGMGGHSGGALASELVVSQLHVIIPALLGDYNGIGNPSALLEKTILTLHEHILRTAEGRPEVDDMGATVVCSLFSRGEIHYAHVGDSRLYRFRNGRLEQLTEDHSFVGRLLKEGKINEKEARVNPRKNILTQAIGAQCLFIHPDVNSSRVRQGDWYLICSDGLIDGLWDKHIEQEFLMAGLTNNTPKGVTMNLLERAYKEAGRDDTTLFVIHAE